MYVLTFVVGYINIPNKSYIIYVPVATNTPSLLPKLKKVSTNQSVSTENDEDQDLDISLSTDAGAEGEGQTEVDTGNQTILKLLEEGEKVLLYGT